MKNKESIKELKGLQGKLMKEYANFQANKQVVKNAINQAKENAERIKKICDIEIGILKAYDISRPLNEDDYMEILQGLTVIKEIVIGNAK